MDSLNVYKMKKWLLLSVVCLLGLSAFVRVGWSTLGDNGVELYYYHRTSKYGHAMRVVPFRSIEVWPIGPTVHGGMADGETVFKIGR